MDLGVQVKVVVPESVEPGVGVRMVGSVEFVWAKLKVAVTVVACESVTWQEPAPLQPPPLHSAKTELVPAEAERVTGSSVFVENCAVHELPQLRPAGVLEIVPCPAPFLVMVSGTVVGVVEPVEYWKSVDCQLEAN